MKFIEKVGGTNYYLSHQSMGCYGEPEGHPNHTHSICQKRGGHEVGSSAISYIANDPRASFYRDYAPKTYAVCVRLMKEYEEKGKR